MSETSGRKNDSIDLDCIIFNRAQTSEEFSRVLYNLQNISDQKYLKDEEKYSSQHQASSLLKTPQNMQSNMSPATSKKDKTDLCNEGIKLWDESIKILKKDPSDTKWINCGQLMNEQNTTSQMKTIKHESKTMSNFDTSRLTAPNNNQCSPTYKTKSSTGAADPVHALQHLTIRDAYPGFNANQPCRDSVYNLQAQNHFHLKRLSYNHPNEQQNVFKIKTATPGIAPVQEKLSNNGSTYKAPVYFDNQENQNESHTRLNLPSLLKVAQNTSSTAQNEIISSAKPESNSTQMQTIATNTNQSQTEVQSEVVFSFPSTSANFEKCDAKNQDSSNNRRVIFTAIRQKIQNVPNKVQAEAECQQNWRMDENWRRQSRDTLIKSILLVENKLFSCSKSRQEYYERFHELYSVLTKFVKEGATLSVNHPKVSSSTQTESPLEQLQHLLSKEPLDVREAITKEWNEIDKQLEHIKLENNIKVCEEDLPFKNINLPLDEAEAQLSKIINNYTKTDLFGHNDLGQI